MAVVIVRKQLAAPYVPVVQTEAGTSRTLNAGDNGTVIFCNSSSPVTITTATGLGTSFNCTIIQGGTGKVTLAQGSGTTLSSYSGLLSTMGQYAAVSVLSTSEDVFVATGNLGV